MYAIRSYYESHRTTDTGGSQLRDRRSERREVSCPAPCRIDGIKAAHGRNDGPGSGGIRHRRRMRDAADSHGSPLGIDDVVGSGVRIEVVGQPEVVCAPTDPDVVREGECPVRAAHRAAELHRGGEGIRRGGIPEPGVVDISERVGRTCRAEGKGGHGGSRTVSRHDDLRTEDFQVAESCGDRRRVRLRGRGRHIV